MVKKIRSRDRKEADDSMQQDMLVKIGASKYTGLQEQACLVSDEFAPS